MLLAAENFSCYFFGKIFLTIYLNGQLSFRKSGIPLFLQLKYSNKVSFRRIEERFKITSDEMNISEKAQIMYMIRMK